jgi:hypothetical protein
MLQQFLSILDSEYAEGEVEYMYDSNTAETGKNKPMLNMFSIGVHRYCFYVPECFFICVTVFC